MMSNISFEFACRDDCLDIMLPSDLRKIVFERDRLQAELTAAKAEIERLRADNDHQRVRRNAARDCIKRMSAENEQLRGRLAELETMVKVFRGCIETGVMPGQGSRCHKIVHELVGERDDA